MEQWSCASKQYLFQTAAELPYARPDCLLQLLCKITMQQYILGKQLLKNAFVVFFLDLLK